MADGSTRPPPEDFDDLFDEAGAIYDLDPRWLKAHALTESGGDPYAIGPDGEDIGLMQLRTGTARDLGVEDRLNPRENVFGGARYLRQMLDRFDDPAKASMAYNAGPAGNWNPDYVRKVSGHYEKLKAQPWRQLPVAPAEPEGPPFDPATAPPQAPPAEVSFDDLLGAPQGAPPPAAAGTAAPAVQEVSFDDLLGAPPAPVDPGLGKVEPFAPPRPSAWGAPSTRGQLNALAQPLGGVGPIIAGAGRATQEAAVRNLDTALGVMDRVDAGEAVPDQEDVIGYQQLNPEQRAKVRGQAEETLYQEALRRPNAAMRLGNQIVEFGKKTFPVSPEDEGIITRSLSMVGALPGIIAPAIAGGVVGGPGGAIAGGAAAIAAQSYDATYQQALAAGKNPREADQAARTNAAVQAGLMAVPVGRVIQNIPAPLRDGFTATMVNLGKRGLEFGSFNALAAFADNYVAQQTFDPERKLTDHVADAALEGLIAGPLIGAVGAAIRPRGPYVPDWTSTGTREAMDRASAEWERQQPEQARDRAARGLPSPESTPPRGQEPPPAAAAPPEPPPAPAPTPAAPPAAEAPPAAPRAPERPAEPAAEPPAAAIPMPAPAAETPAADRARSIVEQALPELAPRGDRSKPVSVQEPGDLAAAGAVAAEPTPAQAEAGNYRMGHITVDGLPATIETPEGGIRRSKPGAAEPWEVEMPAAYGYIKGTRGADGDHVDAYFGPETHQAAGLPVFVIDQRDLGTGNFDEHKAMIGFPSREWAEEAYRDAFSDGRGGERLGAVTEMPWPAFRAWVESKHARKPLQPKAFERAPAPAEPAASQPVAGPGSEVPGASPTGAPAEPAAPGERAPVPAAAVEEAPPAEAAGPARPGEVDFSDLTAPEGTTPEAPKAAEKPPSKPPESTPPSVESAPPAVTPGKDFKGGLDASGTGKPVLIVGARDSAGNTWTGSGTVLVRAGLSKGVDNAVVEVARRRGANVQSPSAAVIDRETGDADKLAAPITWTHGVTVAGGTPVVLGTTPGGHIVALNRGVYDTLQAVAGDRPLTTADKAGGSKGKPGTVEQRVVARGANGEVVGVGMPRHEKVAWARGQMGLEPPKAEAPKTETPKASAAEPKQPEEAPKPETKNEPGVFNEGQRVVITAGPYAGRHGVVTKRNSLTMQPVYGGKPSATHHSYEVKTDGGMPFIGSRVEAETGEAPKVVPDPRFDGHVVDAETLNRAIEHDRKEAKRLAEQADRARTPKNKQAALVASNELYARARAKRQVLDAWKAAHPEEAARLFPANQPAGKPQETAPKPEAKGVSQPADLPIIEHVTGKGKTLRGVVRTDLSQAEAKAIDKFTFRKAGSDGKQGWFIREEHLKGAKPAAEAPKPAEQKAPEAKKPEAPFAKPSAEPGSDEHWWDKELTPTGRRQILDAAEVRNLHERVLWHNIEAERQERILDWREAQEPVRQPEEAPRQPEQPEPETAQERPQDAPGFGADNKFFTADAAARARARLKEKLSRLNAGFDPEMAFDGLVLSGYYIEGGLRKFPAYAKAMLEDLGEAARPHLDQWYTSVRKQAGFDTKGMDDDHAIQAALKRMEERPTSKPEETDHGVQGTLSPGNEPAGPQAPAGTGQERETGRAPEAEGPGGNEPAGPVAGAGAKAPERKGRSEQPANGRGAGEGNPDRLPAAAGPGEGGAAGRPAEPRAPDAEVRGENFVIAPGALDEGRGPALKARDNIAAIRLALALEADGRAATKAEQAVLAKYVGWGGLSGAFPNPGTGQFTKGLEKVGADLRDLLPRAEYDAARASTQFAHYTAENVIRSMWDAVGQMGFKGGSVFEPGMGVGHFLGMMPGEIAAASQYHGVELDHTTARIAKLLYPRSGVQQADFVRHALPEQAFDLVIGNPPFSDTVIKADPKYSARGFMLHDYFFAKSLDAVRPGGLLAFVTSAGTMNKMDPAARQYLAERAEFLGGVRLPSTAFKKNAGTEVTTDILFFQRRPEGIVPLEETNADWTGTTVRTLPDASGKPVEGHVSNYFSQHPEMVLGEEGFFDKLYKGRYAVHETPGADLTMALQDAMAKLPRDVMTPPPSPEQMAMRDFQSGQKKDGSFYMKDGQLMQYSGGVGRPVPGRAKGTSGGMAAGDRERVQNLIPIRDALRDVFMHDLAEDAPAAAIARKALNRHYDNFVKKYGPINKLEQTVRRPSLIEQERARQAAREDARTLGEPFDPGSFDEEPLVKKGTSLREIAAARQEARMRPGFREGDFVPDEMADVVIDRHPNITAFMGDPESYRLRAIEDYNDVTGAHAKREIFSESVLKKLPEPQINSANDGVLWSMNEFGRFDLDKIAAKMGKPREVIIAELGDKVFRVPGKGDTYQTRDEYLSGDVVSKLEDARAVAGREPDIRPNIIALEAAVPPPIPPSQLSMALGMPWIPVETQRDFIESLGLGRPDVQHAQALGQWFIPVDKHRGVQGARIADVTAWGTDDYTPYQLIEMAMNRTSPRVTRTEGSGANKTSWFDAEATQAAQDKVDALKQAFKDWVDQDPDRGDGLADIYNRNLNRTVLRVYDGSYLTTPGVAAHWSWRPHQTRVVARIVQAGNTYMAHAVGAGKTSAAIGAGMEMKRLGLVNKPMYVVPRHMLGQFAKEFYEQYPLARIAVADDDNFHTDRRRQFVANVSQQNLDAVIITHTSFGKVPISEAFQDNIVHEAIAEIEQALAALDATSDRFTVKRLENQKAKLQQKLSKRKEGTDQTLTFEEMGVDFLFVDEAHLMRKLQFATKQGGLKGVDPKGSDMSWDLYTKSRYLDANRPGRSMVMMSGTPVTNTMGELYTLSRFMQPQALRDRGISHFDSWAQTFGDTKTEQEQTADGSYEPVTRFSRFVNMPELYKMVGAVMDIVTPSQLEQYVTRPKLMGGQRQFHLAPRTPEMDAYQQVLADRVRAIKARKGKVEKGDDILLSVINDGRHAAIDPRFVSAEAPADTPSKLNEMIANVLRIWKETKNHQFYDPGSGYTKPAFKGPATQMIFANLGVNPRGPGNFSGYAWIKQALVRGGVPANEIAFIGDYKSHLDRQRLFNDVNEGKVRILVGSGQKMGTGVNAQRRLIAIHNQDPLWYPADDEQRNGRGIRQGNYNPEIAIHDYSTKGTYDATMWQMMGRKGRFIEQFFRGDPELREMEDLGEASWFEQASAMATMDERVIQLTEMKQDLDRAYRRKGAFESQQYSIRQQIKSRESNAEYHDRVADRVEGWITKRIPTRGDAFAMQIGDQRFTKRKEAAEALGVKLNAVVEKAIETANDHPIKFGEIGGFPLTVEMAFTKKGEPSGASYRIATPGAVLHQPNLRGGHTDPEALIWSAEDHLAGWEEDISYARRRAKEDRAEAAEIKPLLDKTFEGGPEIDSLAERIRKLESEIKATAAPEANPPPAPDASGPVTPATLTRPVTPQDGGPSFGRRVPLYSAVDRAVGRLAQAKGTGEQMLAQIMKAPGVKAEEVKWLGLDTWLRDQKSVTRDQIKDYVAANQLQVEEVLRGEPGLEWQEKVERDGTRVLTQGTRQEAPFRRAPRAEITIHPDGSIFATSRHRLTMEFTDLEEAKRFAGDELTAAALPARHPEWKLPGGRESYRELLITLPEKEERPWHVFDPNDGLTVASFDTEAEAASDARRRGGAFDYDRGEENPAVYRSSHWDEPNVLAHIRFTERRGTDGKRVLMIEEEQSDWHQQGRREGYKSALPDEYEARLAAADAEVVKANEAFKAAEASFIEAGNAMSRFRQSPEFLKSQAPVREAEQALEEVKRRSYPTTREMLDAVSAANEAITAAQDAHQERLRQGQLGERWAAILQGSRDAGAAIETARKARTEAQAAANEIALERSHDQVPDAPFKTTWPMLAMRRMIAWAVEHGYDRVAWSPGEVHAKRYSLSHHLSSLHVIRKPDGRYSLLGSAIDDGRTIDLGLKTAAQLPDAVGKEMADRIIKDGRDRRVYSGEAGLKVGGGGMQAFYDRILPAETNKIVGRFGAKVEAGKVVAGDGVEHLVHEVTITPQLRDAVRSEGLPLFQRTPADEGVPHPATLQAMLDAAGEMLGGHVMIEAYDPDHQVFTMRFRDPATGEVRTEQVFGYAVGRLIRLAIEGERTQWNLDHESLHALVKLGVIKPEEWATLAQQAQREGWMDEFQIDRRYPNLPPGAARLEEAIAEKFAQHGAKGPLPPGLLGRIIGRIRQFLARLRNLLGGRGFRTAEDVFGKMRSGEIGRREPGSEGPQLGPRTIAESIAEAATYNERTFGRRGDEPQLRAAIRHNGKVYTGGETHLDVLRDLPLDRAQKERAYLDGGNRVYVTPTGRVLNRWKAADYARENDLYKPNAPSWAKDSPELIAEWLKPPSDMGPSFSRRGEERAGQTREQFLAKHIASAARTRRLTGALSAPLRKVLEAPKVQAVLNGETMEAAREKLGRITRAFQMVANPMSTGPDAMQVIAKDFANDQRAVAYHLGELDKQILRSFTPEQRAAMGRALDEQSVFEQNLRDDLRAMEADAIEESREASRKAKATGATDYAADKARKKVRADWAKRIEAAELEARQQFTGKGLERLPADQRAMVELLNDMSQRSWEAMKEAGIVSGERLPYYMPRMFADMIGEGGEYRRVKGGEPGAPRGIDRLGANVNTSGPMRRKYREATETERAAKAKLGAGTTLVTDIRALLLAVQRAQRAVASRQLIRSIKKLGDDIGMETVSDERSPATPFTMADHPAFQTYEPRYRRDSNGRVQVDDDGKPIIVKDENDRTVMDRKPIWIAGEMEGPLRAILTKPTNEIYRAIMNLKGFGTSIIMASPMIHNAVIWGRAFELAPGKMLSFQLYRLGHQVRTGRSYTQAALERPAIAGAVRKVGLSPEPLAPAAAAQAAAESTAFMDKMIRAGMVPINGGWMQDILGIAQEAGIPPGKSLPSKALGALAGMVGGDKAKAATRRGVDAFGDFWHGTLLWDRIADLQAGIALTLHKDLMAHGLTDREASLVAAHFANRFAGVLPSENMSNQLRMFLNGVLFSRQFTLGNAALVKDAMTGVPSDVRAQLGANSQGPAADAVKNIARRRMIGSLMRGYFLMLALASVVQTVAMAWRDYDKDKENDTVLGKLSAAGRKALAGYMSRFSRAIHERNDSPLRWFNPIDWAMFPEELTPMHDNEPGKQGRVFIGTDDQGRGIYIRLPMGKSIEELINWATAWRKQLSAKLSTFAGPFDDLWKGEDSFGRPLFDPDDTRADAVGKFVLHFLKRQIPGDVIQGGYDYVTGTPEPGMALSKSVLPLATGITVSRGDPLGPQGAIQRQVEQRRKGAILKAWPQAVKAVKAGDINTAMNLLIAAGETPDRAKTAIVGMLVPERKTAPSGYYGRTFERNATERERARLENVTR